MKTTIIFLIVIFLSLFSCKKDNSMVPPNNVYIYKLKGDYINKVCVMMNDEKTKIIQYNDEIRCSPCDSLNFTQVGMCDYYKLQNNYFVEWKGVKQHLGINSAYLTVNLEDWRNFQNKDSLMNYILDDDPFVEYYYRSIDTFLVDTNLYKHLDEYIANNQLESELGFIRLK